METLNKINKLFVVHQSMVCVHRWAAPSKWKIPI